MSVYSFAKKLYFICESILSRLNCRLNCSLNHIKQGKNWVVTGRFYVLPRVFCIGKKTNIQIGDFFTCHNLAWKNSFGIIQPCTFFVSKTATLKIGEHVGVSGTAICCRKKITIGNHVLIGTGCIISDNDAHALNMLGRRLDEPAECAEVSIGDDCFIGARSIILKGVSIGNGSVVGAGSVVTKSIPENVIAAGNPAKIVGAVDKDKMTERPLKNRQIVN